MWSRNGIKIVVKAYVVAQVVIDEPNEFDPSMSLEKNKNVLPNVYFLQLFFKITKYSVRRRPDKGCAPPEPDDFVSYLSLTSAGKEGFSNLV